MRLASAISDSVSLPGFRVKSNPERIWTYLAKAGRLLAVLYENGSEALSVRSMGILNIPVANFWEFMAGNAPTPYHLLIQLIDRLTQPILMKCHKALIFMLIIINRDKVLIH
jgi:hypothetical protein